MDYYLGLTLLVGLATAAVVYVYDLEVSGPAWARSIGTYGVCSLWLLLVNPGWPREFYAVAAAASLVALLATALVQYLVVQRDVTMARAMRR